MGLPRAGFDKRQQSLRAVTVFTQPHQALKYNNGGTTTDLTRPHPRSKTYDIDRTVYLTQPHRMPKGYDTDGAAMGFDYLRHNT